MNARNTILSLSDGAIDRQFQAGLEMTPKLRDQTGCDVGRL
jgi:hypothetical protein